MFAGYAGWGPEQLDGELDAGRVVRRRRRSRRPPHHVARRPVASGAAPPGRRARDGGEPSRRPDGATDGGRLRPERTDRLRARTPACRTHRHAVVLVRHGQSTWNADGRWQGQADPPLSALGEQQAARPRAAPARRRRGLGVRPRAARAAPPSSSPAPLGLDVRVDAAAPRAARRCVAGPHPRRDRGALARLTSPTGQRPDGYEPDDEVVDPGARRRSTSSPAAHAGEQSWSSPTAASCGCSSGTSGRTDDGLLPEPGGPGAPRRRPEGAWELGERVLLLERRLRSRCRGSSDRPATAGRGGSPRRPDPRVAGLGRLTSSPNPGARHLARPRSARDRGSSSPSPRRSRARGRAAAPRRGLRPARRDAARRPSGSPRATPTSAGRHAPGPARARGRRGLHPAAARQPRHRRHARCASAASTSRPTPGEPTPGRRPVLRRPHLGHRRGPDARWSSTGGRPVAEPFYRATAVEPMGVVRRRHFQTQRPRSLVGLDDEVFDPDAADAGGLHGRGRGRAARRARARAHRPHGRHRRHHPGRAGRGDPRRPRRASSSSPAVPAPARPRSRCTAPRTSSTRTASASRRRACCSSGRARSSCATSTRCSRRSARTRCSSPTPAALKPQLVGARAPSRRAAAAVKGDARMAHGDRRRARRP